MFIKNDWKKIEQIGRMTESKFKKKTRFLKLWRNSSYGPGNEKDN